MQQTADWLEKLGMSEYASRFAENGIDCSVLPDLTEQDLKDLGVLLGHRRKILRANRRAARSSLYSGRGSVPALSHTVARARTRAPRGSVGGALLSVSIAKPAAAL